MGSKRIYDLNDDAPSPSSSACVCQPFPSLTTGGLQNLPIYLIHGVAASPQPAVAAVAHKGQDGVSVCDGLYHELQVQQAAVGGGYHCKKAGSVSLTWELLRAKASPGAPQSQDRVRRGKGRRDGRERNLQNPVGWGVTQSNPGTKYGSR